LNPTDAKSPKRPLTPSAFVLIAANLSVLYGVLALGWDVFPVVFLFWLENVIVGLINILKFLALKPADAFGWIAKIFIIPFFSIHYGMFCMVHGIFVMGLFGEAFQAGAAFPDENAFLAAIVQYKLGWAIAVLAGSHLFSFFWNFIHKCERNRSDIKTLMGQPYARIVVLHLTILGTAFLMIAFKTPMVGMLLLVALKTGVDVKAHMRERKKFGEK
jgi:Family of unknown function (DUF6498)